MWCLELLDSCAEDIDDLRDGLTGRDLVADVDGHPQSAAATGVDNP